MAFESVRDRINALAFLDAIPFFYLPYPDGEFTKQDRFQVMGGYTDEDFVVGTGKTIAVDGGVNTSFALNGKVNTTINKDGAVNRTISVNGEL